MTAITMPEIDRSTVDDLRKKLPNLSELELPTLPSMQQVGKTADQTIDRLLGRSRPSMWPWIAAGIGLVAVIGVIAAYLAWFRRPTADLARMPGLDDHGSLETSGTATTDDVGAIEPSVVIGLTAAETALTSNPYPVEEA